MARITVYTDDGREVSSLDINDDHSVYSLGRPIYGRQGDLLGWLGRALSDARIIQQGGDPERPSEKAMRLMAEQEVGQ